MMDICRFGTLDRNGHFLDPITAFGLNGSSTAWIGHWSRDAQQAYRVGLMIEREELIKLDQGTEMTQVTILT